MPAVHVELKRGMPQCCLQVVTFVRLASCSAARSSPWNNLPYVDALDIMDTLATDAAYYFDYPNEEEYAMAAAACYGINRYAPAGEEPTGPALKQALDPQPYFGQCPPGEFISSISMATGNPLLVAKCSDGTVLSDGVGQMEENDLTEEVDLPQGFDKYQVLGNVEDPSSYNVDVPAGGTAWLAMIGRGFALDRRARWTGCMIGILKTPSIHQHPVPEGRGCSGLVRLDVQQHQRVGKKCISTRHHGADMPDS